MRASRAKYEALKHTGSVQEYIRELPKFRHEISSTPLATAEGDVMSRFLKNLKPTFKAYLENNAPEGWYQDAKSVFDKALHYEVNLIGANGANTQPGAEQRPNAGKLNAMAAKRDSLKRSQKKPRFSQPAYPPMGNFQFQPFMPPNMAGYMPQLPLPPPNNQRRRNKVPADIWKARQAAGHCGYCDKDNHSSEKCFHKYSKN